jgi:hypothetical protein
MDPKQQAERERLLGPGERSVWATDEDDHDNRGWNRLSIRENSRKAGRPPMQPGDLLLPSGLGNRRMLASCAAMSGMSTLLYVWVPLMLLNFFVDVSGLVMVFALGGAFMALTVGLYLWGTIETQRDRELGARL